MNKLKYIICLVMFFLSSYILFTQTSNIAKIGDTIFVSFSRDGYNTEIIENNLDAKNLIIEATYYDRISCIINSEHKVINDSPLYFVNPNYLEVTGDLILQGRFFIEKDHVENNFIVIDKNTATFFFASIECIGKKLYIEGNEYNVIGVLDKSSELIDLLSETDKFSVYRLSSPTKTPTHGIIKARKGMSDILLNLLTSNMISNNANSALFYNVSFYNDLSKFIAYGACSFLLLLLLTNFSKYIDKDYRFIYIVITLLAVFCFSIFILRIDTLIPNIAALIHSSSNGYMLDEYNRILFLFADFNSKPGIVHKLFYLSKNAVFISVILALVLLFSARILTNFIDNYICFKMKINN